MIAHADRPSTRFVDALRPARAARLRVRGDWPKAALAFVLARGDAATPDRRRPV